MRTHRFGRNIKLPSTIAIKHQVRVLMDRDLIERAEAETGVEVPHGQQPGEQELIDK
jgi:hypothetical protein